MSVVKYAKRSALLVVPVLVLVLCEGILWMAGVPVRRPFFEPATEVDGTSVKMVPSDDSPWGSLRELFPDVEFMQPKPDRVYRLFCVGESTTRGFPFDPHFSFGKWLRIQLQAMYPDWKIEVHVCGKNGSNAYAVAPLVEELMRYEPDAVLAYCGQNELHSWNRGIIERPLARRCRELAERFRLGRLLLEMAGGRSRLEAEVDAPEEGAQIQDAGEAFVSRSRHTQVHRERAFDLYERSVRRMAAVCRAAGVPLLLCRLVVNVRDWPPTVSVLDSSTSTGAEALASYHRAMEELQSSLPVDVAKWPVETVKLESLSLQAVEQASLELQNSVALSPETAAFQYLLGRTQLRLGRIDAAKLSFLRALECDDHPLRAVPRFNAILERVADTEGVRLVDAEPLFCAASEDGIPGNESFVEHVHPTLSGQHRLADASFQVLWTDGLLPDTDVSRLPRRPTWADAELAQGVTLRAPDLARKFASLGLRSLASSATQGVRIRPIQLCAFRVATELDPACVEAQLGDEILRLAAGGGEPVSSRIRTLLEGHAGLRTQVVEIARAHADWQALLKPVLLRP